VVIRPFAAPTGTFMGVVDVREPVGGIVHPSDMLVALTPHTPVNTRC
jgi:hypothetical protein